MLIYSYNTVVRSGNIPVFKCTNCSNANIRWDIGWDMLESKALSFEIMHIDIQHIV